MALAISKLKGAAPDLVAKLRARGVNTADELFEAALTAARRRELAAYAGVPEAMILELANRADLARIKGIAGVYSDLLEEAGVDTIKELRGRDPAKLHARMMELNTQMQLTARPPALSTVKNWVSLARRRRKFLKH
jgi:hypothetical protein